MSSKSARETADHGLGIVDGQHKDRPHRCWRNIEVRLKTPSKCALKLMVLAITRLYASPTPSTETLSPGTRTVADNCFLRMPRPFGCCTLVSSVSTPGDVPEAVLTTKVSPDFSTTD
jgi:hypothetical protein